VEELGHEVFSFTDPGEALDFARGTKVDISLLAAPEGLDMIKHLREISTNFKVVLLSSDPDLEQVKQGISQRVCSYLFKPIIMKELDGCLKRALLKGKTSTKVALNL
jgi:YesN/AraC family two-component response regulator